ncbi:MAG: hypothetical protein MI748_05600 [Opitutales bacterium]|nr:hypothetical protein [Opitutales bacterium]
MAETDRSLIYKRHQIIQNRKTSSLIATLVLVSLGISLLFKLKLIPLPTPFLSIGIGAVIYLMIPLFWKRESRIKEWVKNMLCAGVYAVACASPTSVYSCGSARPSITFLTNTVMLALMILLNLRLIENHEKDVRGVGKHCPLLLAFILMTSLLSVNVLTVCWTSSSIAMVILSLLPWKLGKPISFDLILFPPALFALIW